jgi:predicted dehydrogenase
VGLGYWGPNLVRNLLLLEGCARVTACDIDEARRKRVHTANPSVALAASLDEVLSDPTVDAVVLATPVATHVELALRVVESGRPVLVEKPLATSAADARRLLEEATRQRVLAMAGHTFLYSPAVQLVRGLVADGTVGDVHYVQSSRVNLGIHQSDVSVLWDLAPHDLSILVHWLGEHPVWVAAHGRVSHGDHVDVAFLTAHFASGCVASLHLSWTAPTKIRRMLVVGSRTMVVYEDTHPEEPVKVYDRGVAIPDPEDFGEYRLTYRTGDVWSPRVDTTEPLRVELDEFLRRVAAGEVPGRPEEDALAVVRAVEAGEQSLRAGGAPVEL